MSDLSPDFMLRAAEIGVGLIVAAVVGKLTAEQALREGKAANRRLDKVVEEKQKEAIELASFKSRTETILLNHHNEIEKLRPLKHAAANTENAVVGNQEHIIELLTDLLTDGKGKP